LERAKQAFENASAITIAFSSEVDTEFPENQRIRQRSPLHVEILLQVVLAGWKLPRTGAAPFLLHRKIAALTATHRRDEGREAVRLPVEAQR
jgi:hypothetical protein